MKKTAKGEYGYLAFQKKWTIIRTVIYFALSISIFVIGIITTGDRKNLLTIVAVLGCLPASKSLVNAIMFARASGCSVSLKEKIDELNGDFFELYDLYMTSYKQNFPISHLVIAEKTIVCMCENGKIDVNAAQNHIEDHLKQDGHKNLTVKVYSDTDKYLTRLEQLKELETTPLPKQDEILEMFISISL